MSELKEVMSVLTEIKVSTARVEEKMEGLAGKVELAMQLAKDAEARTNKRIDQLTETVKDHDERIRGNEKRSAIFGAVGGSAAGIGISIVIALIKSKM